MDQSRQVIRAAERSAVKCEVSAAKWEARQTQKKPIKRNPIRQKLLTNISTAMAAHHQREDVGDMRHLHQAIDMNQEFIDRSRGHGKDKGFIKSVVFARNRTTYFPPELRR